MTEDPAEAISFAPTANRRTRLWLHRAAIACAVVAVIVSLHLSGLLLRHWAWDQTEPIRFTGDISNAFTQGTAALQVGYLNRYDAQANSKSDEYYSLDYAPARLLIAMEWTRYVRQKVDHQTDNWELPVPWPRPFYDQARVLNRTYELCRPLLIVNVVGESIAAAGVLTLVWIWTGRGDRPRGPAWRAFMACSAYALFWFDPELIWNAHCWPQWDSWLLPFFLWAVVSASLDAWFIAGLCIAAGVMFKAQILFGAPLLILWPAFAGRWREILKFIIGFVTGIASLTAVWLVRVDNAPGAAPLAWVIGSAVAFIAWLVVMRTRWPWYARLVIGLLASGLTLWPFTQSTPVLLYAMVAVAVLGLLLVLLPRTALPYTAAAWVAVALLLCPPLFGGSMAWFSIGVAYGTRHYVSMGSGPNNNLAELMMSQYHWGVMDSVLTLAPHSHAAHLLGPILATVDRRVTYSPDHAVDVPLKYALLAVFVVAMICCGLGAARQSRRGSPRFLMAITAPWVVLFTVMPQMHQRYLLWGAAISACTAVLGPGFAMLHLLVSTIAVSQEALSMSDEQFNRLPLLRFFQGWHPGIAWALMLTALIYVFVAVSAGPTPRRAWKFR